MASLPVGGLYHHYRDILKDLWLLWELMLLAEPIVIIAPDPGVCSEAVVSLVDIINPVRLFIVRNVDIYWLTMYYRYHIVEIIDLISLFKILISKVL